MAQSEILVETTRGDIVECVHSGHVVICDGGGKIVESWGNPAAVIYPRSSCKMVQALPLLESGAADAAGLTTEQLALACASHTGAAIHTDRATRWLSGLGLSEDDLRCGPQEPTDIPARNGLIKSDNSPCQLHNNCSGKHCGFLTLNRHLGGSAEYIDPDHMVQRSIKQAFEEVTGMDSPGYGIDGCSAPNFATSVHGLARAMAQFAASAQRSDRRASAQSRLFQAMATHPALIAGEGATDTALIRALNGRGAVKTGADGVYTAILPDLGFGIALKITDGTTRASECAITALLIRLGALPADHPTAKSYCDAPIKSRRGFLAGMIRPAAALR